MLVTEISSPSSGSTIRRPLSSLASSAVTVKVSPAATRWVPPSAQVRVMSPPLVRLTDGWNRLSNPVSISSTRMVSASKARTISAAQTWPSDTTNSWLS